MDKEDKDVRLAKDQLAIEFLKVLVDNEIITLRHNPAQALGIVQENDPRLIEQNSRTLLDALNIIRRTLDDQE